MRIGVKIDNPVSVKGFAAKCLGFEGRFMGNLRVAARKSGADLVRGMRATMEDGDWVPNAELYADWKRRHGYGTQPLFRTHLLANSISHKILEFDPTRIKGMVGWYRGARYGGMLKEGAYRGRVPKHRRRDLGRGESSPLSRQDTQYLSDVAYWNETGSQNRPERPFVEKTYETFGDMVISHFMEATTKSMPLSGLGDAPF